MKITVDVKARSREERVEKTGDGHFKVRVKEPPVDGRANEAVCRVLGKYFNVAPSRVTVVSGHTSKRKIVEVL
ncbi:MAG: DUF167 domain-containing protein [Planctomycetota bacterium]